MQEVITRDLAQHGIRDTGAVYWNLPAARLYEEAVRREEGLIACHDAEKLTELRHGPGGHESAAIGRLWENPQSVGLDLRITEPP